MGYQLHIPDEVYAKIMYWVNKSNNEVGGMGLVSYDSEDKSFMVVDAFLLEQEVGPAMTDLNAEALGKLEYEHINSPFPLRFWWHSHVNMNCFWSGTDVATIKNNGKEGWMVATVFNKKNEMRSALAYKAESEFGTTVEMVDDIDTIIMLPMHLPTAEWDAEYEAKVKEHIPKWKEEMEKDKDHWLANRDTKREASILTPEHRQQEGFANAWQYQGYEGEYYEY